MKWLSWATWFQCFESFCIFCLSSLQVQHNQCRTQNALLSRFVQFVYIYNLPGAFTKFHLLRGGSCNDQNFANSAPNRPGATGGKGWRDDCVGTVLAFRSESGKSQWKQQLEAPAQTWATRHTHARAHARKQCPFRAKREEGLQQNAAL